MNTDVVIRIENLNKSFGEKSVLNNFNFGSYNEFSASDIVKINGYVN